MSEGKDQKATIVALVVLGLIITIAPLVPVVLAVAHSGFGLNRATIVLVLAAVALVGVFALWLRSGAVVTPAGAPPRPLKERAGGGFWKQLLWLYRQDFPGKLIGFGPVLFAILLAIVYVEYVEPMLK